MEFDKSLFINDGGLPMYKLFFPQSDSSFDYSVQRDSAEIFLFIANRLSLVDLFQCHSDVSITCRECNTTAPSAPDDSILSMPVKDNLT